MTTQHGVKLRADELLEAVLLQCRPQIGNICLKQDTPEGTAMFPTWTGHGINKLFQDQGDGNQTLGGVDRNYSNVEWCAL